MFVVCHLGLMLLTADPGWLAPPEGQMTEVSVGSLFSCATKPDKSVVCWGIGEHGETKAPGGKLEGLTSGWHHTCALEGDAVRCWGAGERESACGCEGDSCGWECGQSRAPRGSYKKVVAGDAHTCALGSDGAVVCWGDNRWGQATAPEGEFVDVAAGHTHTCAIKKDGTARCWGHNQHGQSTPAEGKFEQLTAGAHYTCGLDKKGVLSCWGIDAAAESAPDKGGLRAIDSGGFHTCALTKGRTVTCWGQGMDPPSPAGKFEQIAVAHSHGCGVKSDKSVACWLTEPSAAAAK